MAVVIGAVAPSVLPIVVIAAMAPAVVVTRLEVLAVVVAGRIVRAMTGLGNRSAAQRQCKGGTDDSKLGVRSVLHLVSLTWGQTTRWLRSGRGLNWT
jgi:hypothetical protein